MSNIFVGTSGWNYPHWRGVFYPKDLEVSKWLEYYSGFFNAVELNVTFYRLIEKKIFRNWYKRTPKNFFFIVKGSRFITHMKKIKDLRDYLNLFLDNCLELSDKLASFLWQFPPMYKKDLQRLEKFLKLLKKTKVRQAFEFRNMTWFNEEVFSLLKAYNTSLCIADSECWPCIKEITADFVYLRFHGRNGLYKGNYSYEQLKEWVNFIKTINTDIFTFFNNDAYGYAVKNALTFLELLKTS